MASARSATAVRAVVAGLVALTITGYVTSVDAGAAPRPCALVTRAELQRAFDIEFDVMANDRTGCFLFSRPGQPLASIGISVERFPDEAIEAGKQSEQQADGATTIRGVGDLTVYQVTDGEAGTQTVNLVVFDGNVVGRVTGSLEGEAPPVAAMRKIARSLARRI